MASIHIRKNKNGTVTHRVLFRVNGKQRQESFTHPEGAQQFAALCDRIGPDHALAVLESRRQKLDAVPTLREWVDTYLDPESGILTGIEDVTRRDYGRSAERSFLQVLGEFPIDAIDKPAVGKWLAWQEREPGRQGQPVSAKTMRNYHSLLSSVLAAAVDARHIDSNPAHRTKLPKGLSTQPVFLTREQFETVVHFTPEHYKRFVLFLAGTGTRWSEATALTWSDFRFGTTPATVRITKAWKRQTVGSPLVKHPKTSRSRRSVSLWPELVDALGTPGTPSAIVFPGISGADRIWHQVFTRVWAKVTAKASDADLCAELGLEPLVEKPRIHDLRHTHASWLIAAGAPLPFIQARLGHESITTTVNTYGHLLPDAHVRMSEIMADTMSGSLQPRLQLEQ